MLNRPASFSAKAAIMISFNDHVMIPVVATIVKA